MSIYKIQFKNKKGVIEDINLVGGSYAYLEGDTLIINNNGEGNPIYSSNEVTFIDLSTEATLVDGEYQYDLLKNGRYIIDYSDITGIVKINFGTFKYKKGVEEVTLGKFLGGQLVSNQGRFYDYVQEKENSWIMLQHCDFPVMIDVFEKVVSIYPYLDSTI